MTDITLSDEQQKVHDDLLAWMHEALLGNIPEGYTTMAGLAGTGKTTLLGFLADSLRGVYKGIRIAFIAYTGKASIVLKGKLELGPYDFCGTIHSLIYFPETDDTGNIIGWSKRLDVDYDFIFVDEASMVNKEIWEDLLDLNLPIIAIGDHGQLPPISNDSFNLMEDPEFKLETIHRQALDNPIIKLSMIARAEGYIECGVYGKGIAKLNWMDKRCDTIINSYDLNTDMIALCGMNMTRKKINIIIRKKYGWKGRPVPGEKVICLKNNKKLNIMNGQLGMLQGINDFGKKFLDLKINMDGNDYLTSVFSLKRCFGQVKYNEVYAESNNLETKDQLLNEVYKLSEIDYMTYEEKKQFKIDLFDFGYCISVHKSQGSEWDKVILFDERNRHQTNDDYTRWLYTGITRAKEKLIMIEDF